MRLFLNESKRDDLLLPYFELVKDKFPGLTLGKFKTMMLDKLAAQGCINNLSLGSNFYLAGATRYYFQGALTTDNRAALLTGDANTPDNWDTDACKKLNIVINILRNSFIDSIGTKYEVEEDFGKLTIEKLFRKYGKKINAELGIETDVEKEKKAPEINRDPNVGNGYTFDILYSYPEATKYRVATAPGSWCITYGENHYDYYIRSLGGIHYVIFLKNGYEDVPRQTGPGYTRQKPHDEYGNSMIAYLQRNNSWEPTFITSRWNHGYGDTSGTEADHAYTLEEFCNITGVTPEDLQRIYKIWKTDKSLHNGNNTADKAEVKEAMTGALRKLKYAQMMINNGQKPEECLETAGAKRGEVLFGNGEQKKSVIWYSIREKDVEFSFLCDRTNIVFDTFSPSDRVEFILAANLWGKGETGKDIIIIDCGSYSRIYSVRYHTMVDIDGKTKFKRLPGRYGRGVARFIEIKNSFKDIALLSLSNCKPLKLPNGACWFNDIRVSDPNISGWKPRNEIICDIITDKASPIIEIVYDESSREKYFYSLKAGRFLDELNKLTNDPDNAVVSYSYRAIQNPADYELQLANIQLGDYSAVYFTPDYSRWHHTDYILLDPNGRRISIYGKNSFKSLDASAGRYLNFRDDNDEGHNYYTPYKVYDTKTKKYLAIGDEIIETTDTECSGGWGEYDPRFIFIRKTRSEHEYYFIYDSQKGMFIKNPYYANFPGVSSPYLFKVSDRGLANGQGTKIMTDTFEFWEYYRNLNNTQPREDNYERAKEEAKKHEVILLSLNLEYVPNNCPENNEYENTEERAVAPSVVNEEMIRNAVMNAIKKLIG